MEAEANKVGRPTKYKSEYCFAVIEHMREGASVTSFAAEIDVARSTINEWINTYPEFSESVSRAKAKCAAWWERSLRASATTGQGNATSISFGLTNIAPDDWRHTRSVDHSSSDGSMSPTGNDYDAKIKAIRDRLASE